MASVVNTNVSALNAQRQLGKSASVQQQAMARLSSGLRINSASDDAAGLAISNGLISQSRGMGQAIRNAGDGLSMLGTTEGAMVEQTSILQRMREIAVQAASDSNNATNRKDLNGEATQLKNELERIARTTSFNGNNLLDGTFQGKDLQVGAMATGNDRISVSFASTKAADIGAAYAATSGVVTTTALTSGNLTITVGTTTTTIASSVTDGVSTASANASALAKANAINASTNVTGVSADADTTLVGAGVQTAGAAMIAGDVIINGIDVGTGVTVGSATDGTLMASINANFAKTGVTATMDSTGVLTLNAQDGRNITMTLTANGFARSGLKAAAATTTDTGKITLRSTDAFSIGGGALANVGGLSSGAVAQSATENVQAIDLSTKSGAQLAIKIADVALGQMNSRRASIGALTNRLNTTINNLSSAQENAESSKSRILDADFAAETATMQRNSILQQAGIAMLAQANQAPQQVLSLLR